MFFYKHTNDILFSEYEYPEFELTSEANARNADRLYFLNKLDPRVSRRSYLVSSPEQLFNKTEGINLLAKNNNYDGLPHWIIEKVANKKITSINTEYPNWMEVLGKLPPKAWRINVLGLGDVGSTLVTGLRLLGDNSISRIGVYDRDSNKVLRHIYECNQILSPFKKKDFPEVIEINPEELFNCDMFVFCVTAGVPPLGSEKTDVRIAQFEANAKIIEEYARKARAANFKGIFAVISDPVDLLCKAVLVSSNTDTNGDYDLMGLLPEQIRGYGLGVMNARATYYSRLNPRTMHYESSGRAFGPHGEGLVIADSIENYNQELSLYLTEKAQNANLEVRSLGFKPYIAPALSSGSLSLIDTIHGDWHYSSTYMGGVFMGAKNRLATEGIEIEMLKLDPLLLNRLRSTYERLSEFI